MVDAVGGDFAPQNVVAGAIDALAEAQNRFEIIFVGPESAINEQLQKRTTNGFSYRIVHAPEIIDMQDGATAALKQKKNSSIAVGMNLHRDGKADAFVSAGHSGAVMSASTLILGRIEGIGRPRVCRGRRLCGFWRLFFGLGRGSRLRGRLRGRHG